MPAISLASRPELDRPMPEAATDLLDASRDSILQLKIRLRDISPMIWRRVLIPAATTLRELHGIFQVAMGWEGLHLYQFRIYAVHYGCGNWAFDLLTSRPAVSASARPTRQQILWSRRGAHRLLQIRTRTLDGTLRDLFDAWYPRPAENDDNRSGQAYAA